MTAEAYTTVFDPTAVAEAKSLVILVAPIFSFAVLELYWQQRP
jgi:hypothetical protein